MDSLESTSKAQRYAEVTGAIALVLAPTLTFIGWLISHESVASFFQFGFGNGISEGAIELTSSSDPYLIFRYFTLPHYFIYASMPVFIGLAITLAYIIRKVKPWHAFIGLVFSTIGAVYFIGVLGAYLSVPVDATVSSPILSISFVLSTLLFLGNIILGLGLYHSKLVAKWSAALFVAGNFLFFIFPGKENGMTIASLFMIIGVAPVTRRLLGVKR